MIIRTAVQRPVAILMVFAGLVLIDSPRGKKHQGGYVAAPVFGRIMAEALYHLEKGGLRTVLSRAIWAAYQRSRSLGTQARGDG